jgi:hypothetical protein
MWYNTFDSAFWLTIAGIGSACFGLVVKACLKSRCKEVRLFGMSCVRDTEAEDREALAHVSTNE